MSAPTARPTVAWSENVAPTTRKSDVRIEMMVPGASRVRQRHVSVVVNTLNEEARLSYALRSVRPWVDEIVVVDMRSDDRTVEIARQFGAVVFDHARVGYADPARSYGIERSTGDWILVLDADEVVPEPLSRALLDIAESDRVDAVSIGWRNHLLGAPLLHSGWGPEQDRHIRFFRRGAVAARADIHDYLAISEGARVLRLPASDPLCITHFNYVDLSQFLEKLNRYTTIEATAAFDRDDRGGRGRAIARASREVVGRFARRGGFRDGWRGFYLSLLMGVYRLVAVAKLDELRRNGSRQEIEARYRSEAERLLAGYGPPEVGIAGQAKSGPEGSRRP